MGDDKHPEGSLNDRVEDTAFAGWARAEINTIKSDVVEIKSDVRWLKNHLLPIMGIVGAIPTVVAIVALMRTFNII